MEYFKGRFIGIYRNVNWAIKKRGGERKKSMVFVGRRIKNMVSTRIEVGRKFIEFILWYRVA